MEFQEVVRRRRMVRNYADRPVGRAALERIAATAQRAPSAGFSQGVRLVVVTEPARRTAIAEACGEPAYVAAGFDRWVSRAPAIFVPCVSEEIYRARYREPDKLRPNQGERAWPVPYWWLDAGCNVMLVLLAAVDEGLAAGLLEPADVDGLRAALEMPAEYIPVGVITLGYPAADRRSGSLARGWRPLDDFVRWERW